MQHAFLKAVLPAEGLRVVASRPPRWSSGLKHDFVETNDQMIQRTAMLDDDHVTTYFALATYFDPSKKAGRTVANTLQVKSFWIDLDFKEYDGDMKEVLRDVGLLAERFGEATYVVNSGGGLHLYWCFRSAISTSEWEPMADAFQATWQAMGVRADPSISNDAARVLRLPGTHNRKASYDAPRPVRIIAQSDKLYDPHEMAETFEAVPENGVRIPIPHGLEIPQALRLSFDDLIEGMEHRASFIKPIIVGCGQVRYALMHQADVLEPHWYGILQLLRHVDGGEALAHKFSEKHPGYNPREVERKLRNLERKDTGPTTCARLHSLYPAGCDGCPHRITSPIVLGHEDTPPPATETVLVEEVHVVDEAGEHVVKVHEFRPEALIPEGSGFDYEGGRIFRRVRGEDGTFTNVMIFDGFFHPLRIETDPHNNYETTLQIHVHSNGQRPRRIHIPNKVLADKRAAANELKSKGVNFMSKDSGHILTLLETMVGDLESRRENSPVVNQMGWQESGMFVVGTTGHVLGHEPQYDLPALPPIRNAASHYEPAGSLADWKRAANIYNRHGGEAYQFALCYGAAGIFLPDTAYTGVVLSLYSRESGRGKTTVGFGAMSWWGNPDRMKSQAADTNNALFNKASRSHNLPIVIDEITEKPVKDFGDVVYHMSQGREKESLTSNRDPRPTLPPWNLPVITTSNVAIKPMLQDYRGDAQGMFARVFEVSLSLPFADEASVSDKEFLREGFTKNYGLAGPILLRHVMANRDTLEHERRKIAARLDAAGKHDPAYRFWVASCSAALAVAIAARDCGLLSYDVAALERWAVSAMAQQRRDSESLIATGSEILSRFLQNNVNNILTRYMRPTGTGSEVAAFYPEDGVRGSRLVALANIPQGLLQVSRYALGQYCRDNGFDLDGFLSDAYEMKCESGADLRLLKSLKPRRVNLGEGTRTAAARATVMEFDLRHSALVEYASTLDSTLKPESKIRSIR